MPEFVALGINPDGPCEMSLASPRMNWSFNLDRI
jgi:hypothetical protein